VVAGGVGAIIVTGLWAWGFPELRRADRFAEQKVDPPGNFGGDEKPGPAL
jgi:hypothetical protein